MRLPCLPASTALIAVFAQNSKSTNFGLMLKQPPGMQSTCTGCVQYTIFTRCTHVQWTRTVTLLTPSLCCDVCVYLFYFSLFLSSAKTITVCCLPPYCDCLFVGTLGGITYPMDTEFDGMSPEVLSWSRARA